MKDMTREEYMDALRAAGTITAPTIDQMMAVCPHLTREQVTGLVTSGKDSVFFALPPVKVRDAFQIAIFSDGTLGTKFEAGGSGYSGRSQHPYTFMHEAMVYAETHWPEDLVTDSWADYGTVVLVDPTNLVNGPWHNTWTPSFVGAIGVGVDRKHNDFINDRSAPEWMHFDNAITITVTDPLEQSEMRGNSRAGFTYRCCAHCGGGIGLTECRGCHAKYDDDVISAGYITPLPPKLIKLLRDGGHEFGLEPERLLAV